MKSFRLAFLGMLALTCAACSAPFVTPKSPAQVVFDSKTAYAAALVVAVEYKRLPSCAVPNHPPACAEPAVVLQLQNADDIAAPILNAAERAVRTPGFGSDTLETVVAGAQAAVGVFVSLTTSLKLS